MTTTHEQYVRAVADIVAASANADDAAKLSSIKLVFGAGEAGLRGVTYYSKWQNGSEAPAPFVEVCAFGEENTCQLAGTTIHELGHVVAGFEAGHGKQWKDACQRLGLRHCHAAGHQYRWADFTPGIRLAVNALPKPNDGAPVAVLTNRFGRTVALNHARPASAQRAASRVAPVPAVACVYSNAHAFRPSRLGSAATRFRPPAIAASRHSTSSPHDGEAAAPATARAPFKRKSGRERP
ncbi:hypothetical protein LGH82_23580 [Mesorhizobium sp. PAMC28654]|uniref:hypothetical protein n=1 Tax=Mesorhizobium sp. PAMC28654 TaxID=2880934 RepID=UPI001D0A0E57|nr:hypothetical protein [Mesorhizobium sp. PAMC28654]UDL88118.1 hypothetical protein LGH82_23580 [Mesorhizobium sp. PAMC28654]